MFFVAGCTYRYVWEGKKGNKGGGTTGEGISVGNDFMGGKAGNGELGSGCLKNGSYGTEQTGCQ